MQNKACAVILAGGEGKRMKSDYPKVLSEVLFKPMLRWVIDAVKKAGVEDVCVVTGSKKEYVEEYLKSLPFAVETAFQSERLGTGHAVMSALPFLKQHTDSPVLILNGDAPFISSETLCSVLKNAGQNVCTVVSAEVSDPFGYGRILRMEEDRLKAIVEEKEADDEVRKIREVNSGVYCFQAEALISALGRLQKSPKTGEYYLTDTIEILQKDGCLVGVFQADNADSVLGANNCFQLQELNEIARHKVLRTLMENGVIIPCTDGIIVSAETTVGRGTVLLPSTVIRGNSVIGCHCEIGPAVLLENASVPDHTVVRRKVLECF